MRELPCKAAMKVTAHRMLSASGALRASRREQAEAALAWADSKAAEVAAEVIELRVCATCHEVQKTSDLWQVKGVKLTRNWLPPNAFSHADHRAEECSDCHAAETSAQASDILIPHIDTCIECHDDRPGEALVNSQCSDCHGFHGVSWDEDMKEVVK